MGDFAPDRDQRHFDTFTPKIQAEVEQVPLDQWTIKPRDETSRGYIQLSLEAKNPEMTDVEYAFKYNLDPRTRRISKAVLAIQECDGWKMYRDETYRGPHVDALFERIEKHVREGQGDELNCPDLDDDIFE